MPLPFLPDWTPNIHPLLVHFPIAWWIGAVVVDLIALMLPKATWADTTASILYPAGALSAVVTYLTGRRAASTILMPGMAHAVLSEHWNWALATTIAFVVVAVARIWLRVVLSRHHPRIRAALAISAFAALAMLFETGERGGRLVFEHGVGVSAPAGLTR